MSPRAPPGGVGTPDRNNYIPPGVMRMRQRMRATIAHAGVIIILPMSMVRAYNYTSIVFQYRVISIVHIH